MLGNRKIVFFELNEVPYRVYQHYAKNNPGSAIAKLVSRAQHWQTVSEEVNHLSPWVTWPTLHRGVTSEQHHLYSLGQDVAEVNGQFPPIWELLARNGRTVGMFGSLHTYPMPENLANYAFYVPDTFAAGPEAFPRDLSAFQEFNLTLVDSSGRNVQRTLPWKSAVSFLSAAPKLGLRARTMAKVVKQLVSERLQPHRAVRRRTIQSVLSFDFFLKALKRTKPDCAFYFSNHVASAMHRYWPATFPGDYASQDFSPEWYERYRHEIDYSMGEAEDMAAELIEFVERHPEYVMLVAGSMGQAAVDTPEKQITKQLLLQHPEKLMMALGIEPCEWSRKRTMEPRYTFQMEGDAEARLAAALGRITINGEKIKVGTPGSGVVVFNLGQANLPDGGIDVMVGNRKVDPAELGLSNVRVQDEVGSAAYHVPEGCLLIFDPRRPPNDVEPAGAIATTQIAPTLLKNFGITPPDYMPEPVAVAN